MPYVLVSTSIRLENGPTNVGDEHSDKDVMEKLDAKLVHHRGNPFQEYVVPDPPRVVLDKLERLGYRVVTSSGIGQTIVWTLHRPAQDSPPV